MTPKSYPLKVGRGGRRILKYSHVFALRGVKTFLQYCMELSEDIEV